jgi:hypothetical protein
LSDCWVGPGGVMENAVGSPVSCADTEHGVVSGTTSVVPVMRPPGRIPLPKRTTTAFGEFAVIF